MKKLIDSIKNSIYNLFKEEESDFIWLKIPIKYKTKKDQNFMIRRSKDFIIEHTVVERSTVFK